MLLLRRDSFLSGAFFISVYIYILPCPRAHTSLFCVRPRESFVWRPRLRAAILHAFQRAPHALCGQKSCSPYHNMTSYSRTRLWIPTTLICPRDNKKKKTPCHHSTQIFTKFSKICAQKSGQKLNYMKNFSIIDSKFRLNWDNCLEFICTLPLFIKILKKTFWIRDRDEKKSLISNRQFFLTQTDVFTTKLGIKNKNIQFSKQFL